MGLKRSVGKKNMPWGLTSDEVVQIREQDRAKEKITVVSNRTHIVDPLFEVMKSAQAKLKARAYLHWYEKFGLEADQMEGAITKVQEIVSNYSELNQ